MPTKIDIYQALILLGVGFFVGSGWAAGTWTISRILTRLFGVV